MRLTKFVRQTLRAAAARLAFLSKLECYSQDTVRLDVLAKHIGPGVGGKLHADSVAHSLVQVHLAGLTALARGPAKTMAVREAKPLGSEGLMRQKAV